MLSERARDRFCILVACLLISLSALELLRVGPDSATRLGFALMGGAAMAIFGLNRRLGHSNDRMRDEVERRRRATDELQASNERFSAVLEGLDALVYVADMDTHELLFVNKCGRQAWGEVVGKVCWQVIQSGQTGPCVFCTNHLLLDSQSDPTGIQVWEVKNAVNNRWYECRDQAIRWTDGRLVRLEIAVDITERKRAERELRENEEYLRAIMATIQTGVLISEEESGKIVDLNPFAAKLIGAKAAEIIGRPWSDCLKETPEGVESGRNGEADGDGQLKTDRGESLSVRLTKAHASIRSQRYAIRSFTDISDIRELFRRQAVNTELAKGLLSLVSPGLTRHNRINDRTTLHIDALSLPCLAAGGDHFFVRRLPADGNGAAPSTFLSIKDQSGHEVNCILRSIFTDLVHNTLLQDRDIPVFERSVEELNDRLIRGGMFAPEDFVTAMLVRIDHDTLVMRYASCGHPPFLIIRGDRVESLPRAGKPGGNLPLGTIENIPFSAGRIRLRVGDKLLFYTDGLTEMPQQKRGWNLSQDGLEELVSGIARRKEGRRVSDLMRELLSAVSDLSGQKVRYPDAGSSADDVTLIGIEIEDTAEGRERTLLPRDMDELCTQIRELSLLISEQWRAAGLADSARRVPIVLEEAVLNAWKHGHGGRPGRPITVRWREGNDFLLDVIDSGEGFDPNRAADPTRPQNQLNTSGRGIFMIRMYADEAHWRDGGRHLTAGFYRHFRPFDAFQRKPYCNLIPVWETSTWKRS